MNGFKHEFSPAPFQKNCLRCNVPWFELLKKAESTGAKTIIGETNLDYVNRQIYCISDDEYIIKKLLE